MKKRICLAAAAVMLAVIAVLGALLFGGRRYDVASALAAFVCCVPFFLSFEKRAPSPRELVLIAVMTAFSAAGRFIFAPIPFFKPVTALVVIAAMYFGAQAGFMVGALSAVISNIYFGQGVWTPFQMLGWGLIGLAAGIANRRGLLEKPAALCVTGVLAGAVYSLIMDVWTVLAADGGFSFERWLMYLAAALPVTAVYCVSNTVFLLILRKPVGKRLERLKTKYGVFGND